MSDDWKINEFGEIVRNPNAETGVGKSDNDAQSHEYSLLEYEIFAHPERFTADELKQKKARYAELQKLFGVKNDNALKLKRQQIKEKLKSKSGVGQSVLEALIARQNNQNG